MVRLLNKLLNRWGYEISWGFSTVSDPPPKVVRTIVRAFAEEMEWNLSANNYKGGWDNMTPQQVLNELKDHVGFLEYAISRSASTEVRIYAADVANFAMFAAHLWGELWPFVDRPLNQGKSADDER
jgi:hypothetical protein